MNLKFLLLVQVLGNIVEAAPIVGTTSRVSEDFIRIPIYNKHPLNLSSVYSVDVARWKPLANISPDEFSALVSSGSIVAPAINVLSSYLLVCALGTPAQAVELIFDTGSSILWVQPPFYNPQTSTTDRNLNETFEMWYGSIETQGSFHSDKLMLGSVSIDQDIGIADYVKGLGPQTHGLVGFGPPELSNRTSKRRLVPTPMENLLSAGMIKRNVFGVYFERMKDGQDRVRNGEVVLGGFDTTRYEGNITWTDPATSSPANTFWGVRFDNITFGDTDLSEGQGGVEGIADTGATLILLGHTLFRNLAEAIPNATVYQNKIAFPPESVESLRPLRFVVRGQPLILQPEQYTLTRDESLRMGGDESKVYLWVGRSSHFGSLGVTLGEKFLEHFYSVYDGTNGRVGFAPLKKSWLAPS